MSFHCRKWPSASPPTFSVLSNTLAHTAPFCPTMLSLQRFGLPTDLTSFICHSVLLIVHLLSFIWAMCPAHFPIQKGNVPLLQLHITITCFLCFHCRPVYDDKEEAVDSRRLKKSLTMYSSFDWGKVPRIQQRRTSENVFGNPEIITRVYR